MPPITPRGIEFDPDAARPLDAPAVARQLLHATRTVTLATLDPSGHPYSTVTNLLVQADGTPVIYASSLAVHARNLLADPRVSLTLADMATDVLTTPRLTLVGRVVRVPADQMDPLKAAYSARFAKAKLYLALPDSILFRITVQAVHLNGGPARNANGRLTPADLSSSQP